MRRKIVMSGPSSMTVSLPSEWVKQCNLQKGDEVEMNMQNGELVIQAPDAHQEKKVHNLRLKGYSESVIEDMLLALYMKGYHEIHINDVSPLISNRVNRIISTSNIGLEIITDNNNLIILGSMSDPSEEQLDSLIKRLFVIASRFADKIHGIITSDENEIDSIMIQALSVKRLSSYGSRITLKSHGKETVYQFIIIKELQCVAECLYDFLYALNERDKDAYSEKVSSSLIDLLRRMYRMNLHFNQDEYESTKLLFNELTAEVDNCCTTGQAIWLRMKRATCCLRRLLETLLIKSLG